MHLLIVICYIAAIVCLFLAAFGVSARVSLGMLGAALALLAYALPTIAA